MVREIRTAAGWVEEGTWNIAGVYSPKDGAVIYDLQRAFKPSERGGWATGRSTRRK